MVGGAIGTPCARPGAPEFRDTCLARSETSPRVVVRAPLAIFERAVDGPTPEWHSANCSLIDTDDVGLVECRVAVGPRGSGARRPGSLMLVHDNVQEHLAWVSREAWVDWEARGVLHVSGGRIELPWSPGHKEKGGSGWSGGRNGLRGHLPEAAGGSEALHSQLRGKQEEVRELQSRVRASEGENARLRELLAHAQEAARGARHMAARAQGRPEPPGRQVEVMHLKGQNRSLKGELDSAREALGELQGRCAEAEARAEGLERACRAVRREREEEVAALVTERDVALGRLHAQEAAVDAAEGRLAAARREAQAARGAVERERAQAQAALRAKDIDIARLWVGKLAVEAQLADARAALGNVSAVSRVGDVSRETQGQGPALREEIEVARVQREGLRAVEEDAEGLRRELRAKAEEVWSLRDEVERMGAAARRREEEAATLLATLRERDERLRRAREQAERDVAVARQLEGKKEEVRGLNAALAATEAELACTVRNCEELERLCQRRQEELLDARRALEGAGRGNGGSREALAVGEGLGAETATRMRVVEGRVRDLMRQCEVTIAALAHAEACVSPGS